MKNKIATLILAIAASIILLIALGSIMKSVKIKKHGILTESTVLNVSHKGKGLPMVTVIFYLPDGNQVTANAVTRKQIATGDKVMIWYDQEAPKRITFGDTTGYNMRGVIIGGILLIFGLFYFIRFSLNDRAARNLVRSGKKISADFVSVDRNEKYGMGDKNPWIIRCKWIDDRSAREYYFKSKDYIIDPSPYLGGRSHIDVFIDPSDPGKYYMDISFMPKGNNTIG
jgi:hypothetical protein